MITKIVAIRNVGRFKSTVAAGDVGLKRYNLILGGNGHGKSTLCAVLRSLQSGQPSHVLGRRTLGSAAQPEVEVLLHDGAATYSKGQWSKTAGNIAVYDSTFVAETVYSGDAVDLAQRRSLYHLIVGGPGVALARQIEALDGASREKASEVRHSEKTVQALVPRDLSIEQFLGLPPVPDVDAEIAKRESALPAIQQADQLQKRAGLAELVPPVWPDGLKALLGKTLPDLSAAAEERVKKHVIAHNMGETGELWLSEGLPYVADDACPFCGQPFDKGATSLLKAYQGYFTEAYGALAAEIAHFSDSVERVLGDRHLAAFDALIDRNASAADFWSRFCELEAPVLNCGDQRPSEIVRTTRDSVVAILARKAAAPLKQFEVTASMREAAAAEKALRHAVEGYNRAVRVANTVIQAKKAATAATDLRKATEAIAGLKVSKARYSPQSVAAVAALRLAQTQKKAIERDKEVVKRALDAYTRQVVGKYQDSINELLGIFFAGFRLSGTSHEYAGGVPSSDYQIVINDTAVALGDSRTEPDVPSFRNTLSSGDKSTLALAFFVAQLRADPERAKKVVVLDDPFTSQDSFRKERTARLVLECGAECEQVIVLSHDASFLALVWELLADKAAERRALQLAKVGVADTKIRLWDPDDAVQPQFAKDRRALGDYHQARVGEPADIVKKIRPLLETHYRPSDAALFGDDTLGVLVNKIRAAGPEHPLSTVVGALDELNAYTRRYHHGDSPKGQTAPVDPDELDGFVVKTLELTGGS